MRNFPKTEHTRKLPHFQHVGATFFVTTHLEGSIPKAVLEKLKNQRNNEIQKIKLANLPDKEKQIYWVQRNFFQEYDEWLDRCENSPTHLSNPKVATIIEDYIREYDSQYYNLISFTLMPNHMHLVLDFSIQYHQIDPFDIYQYKNLSKVMNLIKGGSARLANKEINNTGHSFWGNEYFDRYIRNHFHYLGAVNYTLNNPIKAKLCQHWMEHPYTWVLPKFKDMELMYPNKW